MVHKLSLSLSHIPIALALSLSLCACLLDMPRITSVTFPLDSATHWPLDYTLMLYLLWRYHSQRRLPEDIILPIGSLLNTKIRCHLPTLLPRAQTRYHSLAPSPPFVALVIAHHGETKRPGDLREGEERDVGPIGGQIYLCH